MTTITESKIDNVISNSLRGEGSLSSFLGGMRKTLQETEENNNSLRDKQLTAAEINAKVKTQLTEYADKQLKPMLQKISKGETLSPEEGGELKTMMNMAGTAGQVANAFNGGIFGILGVIPAIMANFGDYISAAYASFFPDAKDPNAPKSFGEALAGIKAKKEIAAFAKSVGVNKDALMAELTQEPVAKAEPDAAPGTAKPGEAPSNPAPTVSPPAGTSVAPEASPATTMRTPYAPDPEFHASNGTFPPAPKGIPAVIRKSGNDYTPIA